MAKPKEQSPVEVRSESQSPKDAKQGSSADAQPANGVIHNDDQRVNIAEEFYLEVTERPDVRDVLRRLANL